MDTVQIYEILRHAIDTSDNVVMIAHTPIEDLQSSINMNIKPYEVININ